ncbi:MAG: CorA family divalent cation transporter [Pseudomonadota bacterium]|nr:CorA family divalent cation transporter [Pseudomonadota bacterium]
MIPTDAARTSVPPSDPGPPILLWAFDIAPDGAARRMSEADCAAGPPAPGGWRWLHVHRNAPGAEQWLAASAAAHGDGPVPELAVEALMAEDTRPRAQALAGGALVILRGVNLNPEAEPEDMISIRVWVTPGLVVSVVLRRGLLAVQALREAADAGRAPASPGAFLADLTDGLAERKGPVLDRMDDRLAALEDAMEDAAAAEAARAAGLPPPDGVAAPPAPEAARAEIADLRRAAIPLRRYIAAQRDAVNELRRLKVAGLDDPEREALGETAERLTRYVEDLDAMRDRSAALGEQLAGRAAERMNRAMYALSVVTALFLPLGFLTGLMGVNLAGNAGNGGALGLRAVRGAAGAGGGGGGLADPAAAAVLSARPGPDRRPRHLPRRSRAPGLTRGLARAGHVGRSRVKPGTPATAAPSAPRPVSRPPPPPRRHGRAGRRRGAGRARGPTRSRR